MGGDGEKPGLLDLEGLVVDLSGRHDDQEREVIQVILEGLKEGQVNGLEVIRALRRVSAWGVTAIRKDERMTEIEVSLATFYLAYGFRKLCHELGIGSALEWVIAKDGVL